MSYYINYLKLIGLRGIISPVDKLDKEDDDNSVQLQQVVVSVDDDFNIKETIKKTNEVFYRKKFFRILLNILYCIFIISLLSWVVVYATIHAFMNREARYMTTSVFNFLFIVQYFVGLFYYQSEHFIKTMKRIKKYGWYIKLALTLSIVLSILLSLLSVILLWMNYNIIIYKELWENFNMLGRIVLTAILFISKFFSYCVFFINLTIFSSTFIIHSIEIKNYTERLDNYVNNNEDSLTIESIIKDYSELKTMHTQYVIKLNDIFSSVTIFGIIGSYFITINFDTIFIGPLHFVDACCFLVTEVAYIYSISRVKLNVSTIQSIINSPKFVSRYLSRVQLEDFTGELATSSITESGTIIEERKIINTMKKLKKLEKEKNKINFIKDISLRSMIKGHENAEGIDWIILNLKLGGSWENFTLLGFEIDDNTLIKKTIAVVFGLIMLLNLNSIFGF